MDDREWLEQRASYLDEAVDDGDMEMACLLRAALANVDAEHRPKLRDARYCICLAPQPCIVRAEAHRKLAEALGRKKA